MVKASVKKPGDGGEYDSDGEIGDGDGVPQSDNDPISNGCGCIEPCHNKYNITTLLT